jgi:hypothetical protein
MALALAALACSVALAGCSWPWQHSGTCTVRINGHDAAITLSGTPDSAVLQGCQRIINASQGEMSYGNVAQGAITLCSASVSAIDGDVQISVTDTGGHVYGNQFCSNLAQYEADAGNT